ncbi:MAG: SHOCT domain-containing protein [Weeksellaceae bacterium]|nr:SHOCT domain-containing protein [Weeksellaceae bacterium]
MGLFSLPKNPIYGETLLGGFPEVNYKTPVHIVVTDEEITFTIFAGFKKKIVKIHPSDIAELSLNQETYRSAGKAAAGAIIGGVLTGGIGLLAGAAIGGKRRKDNELTLVINYDGALRNIELKESKTLPKLYQELKRVVNLLPQEENVPIDSTSEIEKYFDLKEKGIISAEEFEAKKKQLLGL